jgi:GT2 family glycosyltransferase
VTRNQGADVTVVIPAHGVARYLVGSVASALAQGEVAAVIVVDDRSPDDGAVLVHEAFDDARLVIVASDRAPGVCGARNAGLAMATTPWVLFLDGDDELAPGGIGQLLAGVTPGAVGVFGGFAHITEDGDDHPSSWLADRAEVLEQFPERPLPLRLLPRRTFNPPPGAMLLATAPLRRCGGWDEHRSGSGQSEDFEVVLRLAAAGPIDVVDEPVLLYLHRAGSRSSSGTNNRRRALTRFAAIRRAPRAARPALGVAQAAAYGRLVVPRLRSSRRHPRSLLHAAADSVLAVAFVAFGVLAIAAPRWRPDWPPV